MLFQKERKGDFPVVQWLRICLAMQGKWIKFLAGQLRSHMFGKLSPNTTTIEPACSGAHLS